MIDKALWTHIEEVEKSIGAAKVRETLRRYLLRRTFAGELPTQRKPVPKRWLMKAFMRQGGRCARCGRAMTVDNCTADHRIPLNRGGQHKSSNIDAFCKENQCNSKKGSKNPMQEAKASGRLITEQFKYDERNDTDE